MGANVGIRTGSGLALIDADTLSPEHAKTVLAAVERHCGTRPPVRVGRYPKAGYLVRTDPDFRYARIEFGERNERGLLTDRVEILSEGRQFVAHGLHPVTGKPYRWPQGVPALADVPFVPGATLMALLADLAGILPSASQPTQEGAASDVDQATLRGDWSMIEKAVRATPNTSDLFPTREAWRDYGYAIKAAAGPDLEADALHLFQDWSERWADGENDPDYVAAEWGRFKPPFKRGANWLYELASAHGGGQFSIAEQWFETMTEEEIAAAKAAKEKREAEKAALPAENLPNVFYIEPKPYEFKDPAILPRRQWLYGNHYIRKYVSTTSAPSAVGKSSLSIVEALAMATGKPLLGIQPKGQFRVWLWNGEDPIEEMEIRLAAARRHYGITEEDLGGRLFLNSGREDEIVIATAANAARSKSPIDNRVVQGVVSAIRARGVDCMFLDPFVSTYSGPETNELFDPVVKKWGAIAGATNAAIELVHHTRKLNGAETTVEDIRGGGALVAGARSKRVLAGMTPAEAKKFGVADEGGGRRRFFRVADARVNMALPAVSETVWFELRSVPIGNGDGDTAIQRDMTGDSAGVVTLREMKAEGGRVDAETRAKVVAALRDGRSRENPRSNAWAGYAVATALGLDPGSDKPEIVEILSDLRRQGVLAVRQKTDGNRNLVPFLVVAEADTSSENEAESVFE
jgi:hypothetical protein